MSRFTSEQIEALHKSWTGFEFCSTAELELALSCAVLCAMWELCAEPDRHQAEIGRLKDEIVRRAKEEQ